LQSLCKLTIRVPRGTLLFLEPFYYNGVVQPQLDVGVSFEGELNTGRKAAMRRKSLFRKEEREMKRELHLYLVLGFVMVGVFILSESYSANALQNFTVPETDRNEAPAIDISHEEGLSGIEQQQRDARDDTPTELPTYTPLPMSPTPTPPDIFPTYTPIPPTPFNGILSGTVTLERPGVTPPDPSWSVPIEVTLCGTGDVYPTTTDENGYFEVALPPGTFDITLKNSHTLANRVEGIEVPRGGTVGPIDFGVLREGDANNDNLVISSDFFLLRSTYNLAEGDTGYDDRADFNEDQMVISTDFFMLRNHYNEAGDDCVIKSGQE
jgi:hypothetical protein